MPTRVLVVEDSATQAIALVSVLEENGFEVARVASGEEALACLAEKQVDLVLSDIVMPGLTGYELCRRIKDDDALSALPVVLLTSLSDPVDIVRGLECGADNYVTKPYEPEYLCARVRHVLERQRLRRSPKASLGVNVSFLGTNFSITSDKEQILDLFISSVEEVVRTNSALQESQRELAEAQLRLEDYARSLAQQARVSAEKYAVLMHEANDAILVLSTEGQILEANVRAGEMFGRSVVELRGLMLERLATRASAEKLRENVALLQRETRVEANELEFAGPDGQPLFCDFSASRTSSGEEELVLAILHDVTDLKVTAERLRRSEGLLTAAERFAGLGSWERDLRANTAQWSQSLFGLLGLDPTRDEPTVERMLSVVHPADREMVRRTQADAIRAVRPFTMEFRVQRADGTVRTVQARAEVKADERGAAVSVRGTLQDVTDRKALEEQLHQSQKMEAVGQLAGGVAHDFNNMLTVITSYSGLLLADLPPDDPTREDIAEIQAAAHRAAALTRQLLAFSRRQVLQPQLVDVNALTLDLEKLLRRLVREDIEMVAELSPDIGTVWADPGQLEQVLVNLVVNARDAMPEGGRLLIRTARVRHTVGNPHVEQPNPYCVRIEVSDDGTGMPPEVRSRVFEPFFSTKEPGKGTGLGLSTVYGIVRQSGGEIEVDSTPGEGTTFRIHLPCHDGTVTATHRAQTQPERQVGGETILVVEDDAALRAVAQRILRQHGYQVLTARNGREALDVCEHHTSRIDLVLTDMVMPEMNGFELGAAMALLHPQIRMLFMSGYTQDTSQREELAQEEIAYLEKPFTIEALAAKIREVLDAPAPSRASEPNEQG